MVEASDFRSRGPGFEANCCRFKTWAFFLPGVYARGGKRSHTEEWKKNLAVDSLSPSSFNTRIGD